MTDPDQPTQPVGEPKPGPEPEQPVGRRGQIRHQEPGTTAPRPPTLGEQRARQVAQQRREQLQVQDQERQRKRRKRLLVGGGVTAGVVAAVAIWYAASQPDEVTAYCVADDDVVVEDRNCDESYVNTSGGYLTGGFFYIGGRQYHYHYGGVPTPLGQRVTGGSTVRPKGVTITTRSGTTIQRGGFGIRGTSGKS